MPETVLQLDPRDNVLVALAPLAAGAIVRFGPTSSASTCTVTEAIPAKHKLALVDFKPGSWFLCTAWWSAKLRRQSRAEACSPRAMSVIAPVATQRKGTPFRSHCPTPRHGLARTFNGYHRADGQVGTRNYWLVLPLVFCENRNVERMREALEEELGYGSSHNSYRPLVRQLVERQVSGNGNDSAHPTQTPTDRVFPNVDGIRFLTHQGGCGGTRQDAQALCGLLAGYIHHPNVAGATVLSLGCQNAQASMLMDELRARDPKLSKPVLVFDQQRSGRETVLMTDALDQTFAGLVEANRTTPRTGAALGAHRGTQVRRLRRLQRHLGQPGYRLHLRSARGRGR